MDKKKAVYNIVISIVFRFVILLITLFTRRYLIQYLGDEANGLHSLYISILGFLSIAELGVGTAISFSMYKPIINNDKATLTGLYQLYKKLYLWIGAIVFVLGLVVMLILPSLVKDATGNFSLHITYFIFLIATIMSYLYAFKTSLINAFKDNYITTIIRSVGLIFESLIQIAVLIVFRSFEMFLLAIAISGILQWILTEIVFSRKYKTNILEGKFIIPMDIKDEVIKSSKAMFMHKIGGLLVNTSTSIIISSLISVIILGKYSNYLMIMTGMIGMISLFFSSITSIIGHYIVISSKYNLNRIFSYIYSINLIMGFLFFLGFYGVSNEIITILFGYEQIIDEQVIILMTINYFIQFMRNTVLLFRDASGAFYNDRYKPIIEGALSIILSLILVNYLDIVGILISNIITNLIICHVVEPYILYKYVLQASPRKYYISNYIFNSIFILAILFFKEIKVSFYNNTIIQAVFNAGISVIISLVCMFIIYITNKKFRNSIVFMFKSVLKIFKKVSEE